MKTPDLNHVEETAGSRVRTICEDFLALRDGLGISGTAASVLILTDMLWEIGHDEHGNSLATCAGDRS
ncbi:hypothetical protein [Aeoliella sp.]|uniref:hypothetical protein n=1 Tax=Aeoliella sp. TaxID=2795800 RepID=UPI003CCC2D38